VILLKEIIKKVIESSRILESRIEKKVEIREYCTIHESEIKKGSRIYERVSIKKAKIGENVDINAGTYIEYAVIGDNVQIGPNCVVVGVSHTVSERGAERQSTLERVIIGKRAFIGAGSVITPGVTIGKGSVIGAGSVVTRDVADGQIYVGNPQNYEKMSLKKWIKKRRK